MADINPSIPERFTRFPGLPDSFVKLLNKIMEVESMLEGQYKTAEQISQTYHATFNDFIDDADIINYIEKKGTDVDSSSVPKKEVSEMQTPLFISQIELKDYRTYMHTNELVLSPDPKKPITVVHGVSGEGKTTLLNAIHWCLYGEERAQNKIMTEEGTEGIVNKFLFKSLGLGKSDDTYVDLWIYETDVKGNNRPAFRVKRTITVKKLSESGKLEKNEVNNALTSSEFSLEENLSFDAWDENHKQLVSIDDKNVARHIISKNFPRILAEYLLFDAELIKEFELNKSDRIVKDGIHQITGLPLLSEAKKHLKNFMQKLEKDLLGGDAKYDELIAEKEICVETIAKNQEKIEKGEEFLEKHKVERTQLDSEYFKSDSKAVNAKTIERQDTEERKEEWEKLQASSEEELQSLLSNDLWKLILEKTINFAKNKFDRYQEEGLIPPTVGRDALEKIIKDPKHLCIICDRPITENSAEWDKIVKMKDKVIDNASLREITAGRGTLDNMILDIRKDDLSTKYNKIKDDVMKYKGKIAKEDAALEQIVQFFNTHPEEKISKLEQDRTAINTLISNLEREIGQFVTIRDRAQSRLDEIQQPLNDAKKKRGRVGAEQIKNKLAETAVLLLDLTSLDLENQFKATAQAKTKEFFLKFAPRKRDFSDVKIQPNYVVRALDNDGNPKTVSAGQAHALGLSYLTAVRSIMKKNYFMVIDSPFHNISQQTRVEFVDLFTQIAVGTQTTFFVTDGEYTATTSEKLTDVTIKSVRDHLFANGTLWKEYILDIVCDKCGEAIDPKDPYSNHPRPESEKFDHEPISCTKIREVKSNE